MPLLDALVELPAGRYAVGEPGEELAVVLRRVLVGRWPVVNAHLKPFAAATGRRIAGTLAAKQDDPQLADHPAADLTRADAEAFCAWASLRLGRRVRLPTRRRVGGAGTWHRRLACALSRARAAPLAA